MGLIDTVRREARFVSAGVRTLARVRHLKAGGHANVADELERSVDRFSARTALLFEDERWSYADYEARANRYARWALAQGLKPGDVVALFMENCADYLCVWFGMAKIGAATALINSQLTGKGLAHCVTVASARHVIVDASLVEVWREAAGEIKPSPPAWALGEAVAGFHDLDAALAEQPDSRPDPAIRSAAAAGDVALFIYTSGTTGLPKAARITHLRVLLTMHVFAAAVNARPDDVIYDALPLYHTVGGLCAPGIALTTGGAVAIRRRFSASTFWSDCVRYRATLIQYIGELCRYLVNAPDHPDERRHSVRLAVGNGLRPDVWDRFESRFGVDRIVEFYGATESNLTLFNLDGGRHAIGRQPAYMKSAINFALVRFDPAAEHPVRGQDGRCAPCALDEPGEAIARIDARQARMRFDGYQDQAATDGKILRDVFEPGDAWFRSGDLMRQDRLGYIYFVDRIGDTFRWKGENVSTNEVADILSRVPGVLEANVYGVAVPGADGRAGMAALVVDPAFDAGVCRRQIHDALPAYARPLFLRLTQATETTGTFKPLKMQRVAEGFDPGAVTDPILFDDPRIDAYASLDEAAHADICAGRIRL